MQRLASPTFVREKPCFNSSHKWLEEPADPNFRAKLFCKLFSQITLSSIWPQGKITKGFMPKKSKSESSLITPLFAASLKSHALARTKKKQKMARAHCMRKSTAQKFPTSNYCQWSQRLTQK